MNDHDTNAATLKMLVAWLGYLMGGVTLSNLVLTATLIYTLLQTYVLARKILKGKT